MEGQMVGQMAGQNLFKIHQYNTPNSSKNGEKVSIIKLKAPLLHRVFIIK